MSPERGIGTVVSDLLGEITGLIRNEIRLAKAEVAEKLRSMLMGLVLVVIGVFLLILALGIFTGSGSGRIDAARPEPCALVADCWRGDDYCGRCCGVARRESPENRKALAVKDRAAD